MRNFSDVVTVTRDFSLTYKNAISEALPNAQQIVDRFHIFKNLTDDLCTYLKRTVKDRIKLVKGNTDTEVLTKRQQNKIETAHRKWQTIEEVKKLYADGYTKTHIFKTLGISRMTINKYLTLTEPPVKDSDCILDEYIPLIKKLIIEGKKVKEIYESMKEKGYKGKMTVLRMHMKSIRCEIQNNTSYLKRSKLKKLFFCNLEDIKNEDLKNDIMFYLNQNEELNKIIELVREFKVVIFSKNQKNLTIG